MEACKHNHNWKWGGVGAGLCCVERPTYISWGSLSVWVVPLLMSDFWRVRVMCRSCSPVSGVCGADEWWCCDCCCCCWMALTMLLLLCCNILGSTENWRMLGCDHVLCGPWCCWLWPARVVLRRTGFGVDRPDRRILLKLDSLLLVLLAAGAMSVGFFCCDFALPIALLPAGYTWSKYGDSWYAN